MAISLGVGTNPVIAAANGVNANLPDPAVAAGLNASANTPDNTAKIDELLEKLRRSRPNGFLAGEEDSWRDTYGSMDISQLQAEGDTLDKEFEAQRVLNQQNWGTDTAPDVGTTVDHNAGRDAQSVADDEVRSIIQGFYSGMRNPGQQQTANTRLQELRNSGTLSAEGLEDIRLFGMTPSERAREDLEGQITRYKKQIEDPNLNAMARQAAQESLTAAEASLARPQAEFDAEFGQQDAFMDKFGVGTPTITPPPPGVGPPAGGGPPAGAGTPIGLRTAFRDVMGKEPTDHQLDALKAIKQDAGGGDAGIQAALDRIDDIKADNVNRKSDGSSLEDVFLDEVGKAATLAQIAMLYEIEGTGPEGRLNAIQKIVEIGEGFRERNDMGTGARPEAVERTKVLNLPTRQEVVTAVGKGKQALKDLVAPLKEDYDKAVLLTGLGVEGKVITSREAIVMNVAWAALNAALPYANQPYEYPGGDAEAYHQDLYDHINSLSASIDALNNLQGSGSYGQGDADEEYPPQPDCREMMGNGYVAIWQTLDNDPASTNGAWACQYFGADTGGGGGSITSTTTTATTATTDDDGTSSSTGSSPGKQVTRRIKSTNPSYSSDVQTALGQMMDRLGLLDGTFTDMDMFDTATGQFTPEFMTSLTTAINDEPQIDDPLNPTQQGNFVSNVLLRVLTPGLPAQDPNVLLLSSFVKDYFDDPLSEVDVAAQAEIQAALRAMATSGTGQDYTPQFGEDPFERMMAGKEVIHPHHMDYASDFVMLENLLDRALTGTELSRFQTILKWNNGTRGQPIQKGRIDDLIEEIAGTVDRNSLTPAMNNYRRRLNAIEHLGLGALLNVDTSVTAAPVDIGVEQTTAESTGREAALAAIGAGATAIERLQNFRTTVGQSTLDRYSVAVQGGMPSGGLLSEIATRLDGGALSAEDISAATTLQGLLQSDPSGALAALRTQHEGMPQGPERAALGRLMQEFHGALSGYQNSPINTEINALITQAEARIGRKITDDELAILSEGPQGARGFALSIGNLLEDPPSTESLATLRTSIEALAQSGQDISTSTTASEELHKKSLIGIDSLQTELLARSRGQTTDVQRANETSLLNLAEQESNRQLRSNDFGAAGRGIAGTGAGRGIANRLRAELLGTAVDNIRIQRFEAQQNAMDDFLGLSTDLSAREVALKGLEFDRTDAQSRVAGEVVGANESVFGRQFEGEQARTLQTERLQSDAEIARMQEEGASARAAAQIAAERSTAGQDFITTLGGQERQLGLGESGLGLDADTTTATLTYQQQLDAANIRTQRADTLLDASQGFSSISASLAQQRRALEAQGVEFDAEMSLRTDQFNQATQEFAIATNAAERQQAFDNAMTGMGKSMDSLQFSQELGQRTVDNATSQITAYQDMIMDNSLSEAQIMADIASGKITDMIDSSLFLMNSALSQAGLDIQTRDQMNDVLGVMADFQSVILSTDRMVAELANKAETAQKALELEYIRLEQEGLLTTSEMANDTEIMRLTVEANEAIANEQKNASYAASATTFGLGLAKLVIEHDWGGDNPVTGDNPTTVAGVTPPE